MPICDIFRWTLRIYMNRFSQRSSKHRMIAVEDCDVLEVSTPELDDVVRLEDRYGRTESDKR